MKTKTGFVGLAITALLAVFMFNLFDPSKYRDENWTQVTLKVDFEPVVRKDPIAILVAINAKPSMVEETKESAWLEIVSVRRGSVVSLAATQYRGSGTLHCTISANGNKVGPQKADRYPGPGTQGCVVTMPV
jgi:hypothetical protein